MLLMVFAIIMSIINLKLYYVCTSLQQYQLSVATLPSRGFVYNHWDLFINIEITTSLAIGSRNCNVTLTCHFETHD